MAGIPIVGPKLAVAAAAAAVIAGLARVEAIRRQDMGSTTSLAEGGKVPGQSPTPKSDNVKINATAGEYVHPVSAVKYYGESAMNAIRTMSIPREVIQGWTSNLRMKAAAIRVPQFAHGYAAGGPVQGGQGGTSMSATTNVTLPEELDFLTGRLQSEVEDTVIRVLQQELK